jgi:acetolactate synthase-1/2/3 large subunit
MTAPNHLNSADRFIRELNKLDIEDCFLVTGGAAMFLNESARKFLKCTPLHHEQSTTMAAEGYFRSSGRIALAMTTAGPGAINALNGVFGAYVDSIPMIIVSGQARTSTLRSNFELKSLRQLGDQEADIPAIVAPIVKGVHQFCASDNPESIAQWAKELAVSGRPGPVWVDFPVDIQNSFDTNPSLQEELITSDESRIDECTEFVLSLLKNSQRPTFLLGSGVSNDLGRQAIKVLNEATSIPLQVSWTSIDLLTLESKNFAGRPSSVGDRCGGIIQASSDLIVVFGSSLSIRQVGFNSQKTFSGKVVQIDIDPNYKNKPYPLVQHHLISDPSQVLMKIALYLSQPSSNLDFSKWLGRVKRIVGKYHVEDAWFHNLADGINPYHFMNKLSHIAPQNSIFVCSDATASVVFFQAADLHFSHRTFTNAGSASMGYEIPASIGAAIAQPNKTIICLAGDGSIQLNMQELSIIKSRKMNIKIFILNNGGYLSIRSSQKKHFKNLFLEGPNSGLPFPDFKLLAAAFNIPFIQITDIKKLTNFLDSTGPLIVEVLISPTMEFIPKASSKISSTGEIVSMGIDDLEPFLPEEELAHIKSFLANRD